MEIVTGRVTLDRDEMRSAVIRAQDDRVHRPQAGRVFGIGGDLAQIPTAVPDALFAGDLLPGDAAVVRAVEAALIRYAAVGQQIDAARIGRTRRQTHPP